MPQSNLRALIIDLSQGYGGASSRVLSLLGQFPREQVSLVGLSGSKIIRYAEERGLPVYTVGSKKTDPRIISRLINVIDETGAKVIDTYNVQSKFWSSFATYRSQVAFVSTINSWYKDEHGGNLKGYIYQAVELVTNRHLDLYISVSQVIYDKLIAAGIAPNLIELIQNAIQIDPATIQTNREWLTKTYRLPDNAIVACAVGRLVWAKGYSTLIEAFSLLKDQYPNLYCLVVGDGELYETLNSQIQQAGLDERVRLLGFIEHDHALSILSNSDLFVMPSLSEGTPVALLEAAALARPILTTRVGGIPEVVTNMEHALLVESGNSKLLAEGVERLLQDKSLREQLGSRARDHVLSTFSLQAQIDMTQQAYEKAWEHAQQRLHKDMS
jgi:glycosyltransferase involved in cell wall biosynthesis